VKRQKEVKDVAATRVREGDAVMAVLPASTRASVAYFSNFGVAYTSRITEIPASTSATSRRRTWAPSCPCTPWRRESPGAPAGGFIAGSGTPSQQ
jgi:DNA gyrase/topoisomerase IV subunit A